MLLVLSQLSSFLQVRAIHWNRHHPHERLPQVQSRFDHFVANLMSGSVKPCNVSALSLHSMPFSSCWVSSCWSTESEICVHERENKWNKKKMSHDASSAANLFLSVHLFVLYHLLEHFVEMGIALKYFCEGTRLLLLFSSGAFLNILSLSTVFFFLVYLLSLEKKTDVKYFMTT